MKNYLLCICIVAVLLLCVTEVFAQGTNEVTFLPIVSFGDLFNTLTTALAPMVVGALAFGLSIWVAGYCFKVFRMLAREDGKSRMSGNSIQSHSQSQRSYMSPRQRRRRRNKRK